MSPRAWCLAKSHGRKYYKTSSAINRKYNRATSIAKRHTWRRTKFDEIFRDTPYARSILFPTSFRSVPAISLDIWMSMDRERGRQNPSRYCLRGWPMARYYMVVWNTISWLATVCASRTIYRRQEPISFRNDWILIVLSVWWTIFYIKQRDGSAIGATRQVSLSQICFGLFRL